MRRLARTGIKPRPRPAGEDARAFAEGAARLASTLEVTRRAATARTQEGALAAVTAHFGERTGALLCELSLWNDDQRIFAPAAVWGGRTDRERSPIAEQRFVADVVAADKPVLQRLPDGEDYPFRVIPDRPGHAAFVAGIPIHVHGDVVGALCGAYGDPLPMPAPRLLDEGIAHAAVAGLCLHSAREVETWRQIARQDSLTGCLNRAALRDVLAEETERCERHGRALSCVMIDLDRFKEINDRWGHTAGDEVLIEVGAALQRTVRVYDHVARFGGDEFVIVMPETVPERAAEVVERIADAVERATADIGYPVEISAGIAGWVPGASPGGLLGTADALMFDAKRRGVRVMTGFAPADEGVVEERKALSRAHARGS